MDQLTSEQIATLIGAFCTGSLLGGGFLVGLIFRIFPWQKNAKRATGEQPKAQATPDITDTMQGRDLDATKNALVIVSNTLGKVQDQLEASQTQLTQAQAEITASQEAREAAAAASKKLTEQVTALRTDMGALQSRVDTLTTEKATGESTIKQLREEIAEKDGRIAQLEAQYNTACEDIAALYAFVRNHVESTDEMPVLKTHLKPKTEPLNAPNNGTTTTAELPKTEGD